MPLRQQRALGLRMTAPQHEHTLVADACQMLQQAIGDALPAALGVAGCLTLLNRQHGVEQQHALLRPAFEIARRARQLLAELGFDFLVDVAQARRHTHTLRHRERQPVRLRNLAAIDGARAVIRVLAEDDDAHVVHRRQVQRTEHVGREDRLARRAFAIDERTQLIPIGLRDTGREEGFPVLGQCIELLGKRDELTRGCFSSRFVEERGLGRIGAARHAWSPVVLARS